MFNMAAAWAPDNILHYLSLICATTVTSQKLCLWIKLFVVTKASNNNLYMRGGFKG